MFLNQKGGLMCKPYQIIESLMQRKGLNKHDLSIMTGIRYNTIRGYITSGHHIPLEPLIKIADALNVSVDFLLGRSEIEKIDDIEALRQFAEKVFNNYKANNS